ncbi:hypothetical protein HYFRA_00005215 [Hymenoscyphus fraxineus]|uniref:Uncharacterized protein n=1 Tax=Hymenoscyphus fraxineus TaxID=746836 RepID=A0A9N9Q1W9_9HELO|nr:hypothetical protein HYFRA_00005215 [Hymenoscyphus fraxineus]
MHQDIVNAVYRMEASGWIWEDVFWHLKEHQGLDGISLRALKDWWYRNKGPNDLFSRLKADPRATAGIVPPRLRNPSEQEERYQIFDGEMVKAANALMQYSEAEIESMCWETQEDPYNPIDPLDPLDPANLYMTGVSQNTIAERDSLKRLGPE